MNSTAFKSKSKKESNDSSGQKASDRKKPMMKKRGGGAGGMHDDDSSVDSRGNIRGLIAYSDEEETSFSSSDSSSTASPPRSRRAIRAAAVKARQRIKKYVKKVKDEETSSSSAPPSSSSEDRSSGRRRPRKKAGVVESDDESVEEEPKQQPKLKRRATRRKNEESSSSSEEEDENEETSRDGGRGTEEDAEEDDDEEENEDDDDEDDEDDEEYEDDDEEGRPGLIISFGAGADEQSDRMIPKRHNMKKESTEVKQFVKLVTEPQEEGGIDEQIDEFKRLTPEKQRDLLAVLERRGTAADPTKQSMMFRILTMKLPPETQAMVLSKYNSLQMMDPGTGEYYKQRAWLEKLTSLPLGVYKEIPVKLADGSEPCGAFMERARKCLAEAIYGQEEAKIQILQFIASKIANPDARGLSLLLAGPPGIGKTSLIKNGIARALDWPFQFISLGGDSDASTYTGHQVVYEGSHCGKIANSLVAAKSMSLVLMFDELDKISATPKGEEVQNLLVHLTDPVQNGDFEDKYLSGIPLDLSRTMFTFSANDLGKIDRVLMDRMILVQLQGYSAKDKLAIAESFLLPAALREVALEEKVGLSREVLEHILREYAGDESGVRELKRCIEAVVQKINMLRIFNTKDLPFHIPEFHLPFVVKKSHIDLFLKKKAPKLDISVERMYI